MAASDALNAPFGVVRSDCRYKKGCANGKAWPREDSPVRGPSGSNRTFSDRPSTLATAQALPRDFRVWRRADFGANLNLLVRFDAQILIDARFFSPHQAHLLADLDLAIDRRKRDHAFCIHRVR